MCANCAGDTTQNFRDKEPRLPPDVLIRLAKVCHSYARENAADEAVLRGVDLEVPAGEFVAIHGRSGSGKSTLLNIIGGILPPTHGEVVVAGRDLFRLCDRDLSDFRNHTVGFIFQHYHLAAALTTVENVMVPQLLAGQPIALARQCALARLDEVGLTEKADARPSELSGGQMQRVAIARALVCDPSLLLADEPTGNLDEQTGMDILKLLGRHHRERGLTVVMATHDTAARAHTSRWLHLTEGRLERFGEHGGQPPENAVPETDT